MAGSSTPLDRYRDAELTLEALVDAATRLLRRLDVRPGDGRMAPVPDARGVRYYQTVGVVDRPLRYDGRRAVYGYRHLLQLLSVKRLQQEGHPLQLIQQSLAGRTTAQFERALTGMLSAHGGAPLPSRPEVWQLRPAAAVTGADLPRENPPTTPFAERPQRPDADRGATSLVAARVAPGITVTVDPTLVPDPNAVIALITTVVSHRRKEH